MPMLQVRRFLTCSRRTPTLRIPGNKHACILCYSAAEQCMSCKHKRLPQKTRWVFSLTCPCGETMLAKTLCARSHYCVLHRTHCANAAKLHSPKVSNMSVFMDVAPSLRSMLHGIKPDERVVSKHTAGRTWRNEKGTECDKKSFHKRLESCTLYVKTLFSIHGCSYLGLLHEQSNKSSILCAGTSN